jgi:ribonuclease P protein component
MLPKENRLPGHAFILVKKRGRTLRSKNLTLKVLGERGEDPSRIGIIISTKVSKKAVVRNKIKRRIKESVLKILPKIKNGFDIVLIAKPMAVNENDFFEEVETLFEGIN